MSETASGEANGASGGAPAFEPGAVVAGHVLEERVSRGRFCDVWRARRPVGPAVALKVATSDLGARMLRAEGALGGRLDGCAGVLTARPLVGLEPPAVVMRWVGDRTLRAAFDDAASTDDRGRLFALLSRVAEIVASVHAEGVIHGDLKPENVLLIEAPAHEHGPGAWPLLSDFGLGREVWRERLDRKLGQSLATDAGVTGGTLAYLAPEAVKGAEPSREGDVFALGVMLHEALLGRRPDKVVDREDLRRELSDEETDLLLAALAFRPEDRPDAATLASRLRELLPELGSTGARRRLRWLRRTVRGGLAAFFVAFRYAAVVVILAAYAGVVVACVVKRSPWPLSAFVAAALLHITIRWEGPESPEEAEARRRGQVAWRR